MPRADKVSLPEQLELVGMPEIAERLDVKPQTVRMWRHRGVLPASQWTVGGGPAWHWPDVLSWARDTSRVNWLGDNFVYVDAYRLSDHEELEAFATRQADVLCAGDGRTRTSPVYATLRPGCTFSMNFWATRAERP